MKRVAIIILALALITVASAAHASYEGVDERVVEKIAAEHGRPPTGPLFDAEGDLQLFMFLLAGTVGGFAAGYYYRELTIKKLKCNSVASIEDITSVENKEDNL